MMITVIAQPSTTDRKTNPTDRKTITIFASDFDRSASVIFMKCMNTLGKTIDRSHRILVVTFYKIVIEVSFTLPIVTLIGINLTLALPIVTFTSVNLTSTPSEVRLIVP